MQAIFVKIHSKHIKIRIDSILVIQAAGSYVRVITSTEEYSLSQNLAQFMLNNPFPELARIHRSYAINVNRIDEFDNDHVYIKKFKIPISNNHKTEFMSRIHCLWLKLNYR